MFLIVGYIIILGASLGTYAVHGSLAALWVPMEYIAIVGLAVGGFVAGNDIKVIKATVGALPSIFKGSKFSKALYVDLLAMLFEVLSKVRKEGLMSIENDVENPHDSPIFSKYPTIAHDHHVMEFITDYLRMMVGGNLNALEIENLMDIEIETHHHEVEVPGHVMSKVADSTPASPAFTPLTLPNIISTKFNISISLTAMQAITAKPLPPTLTPKSTFAR